MAYRKKYKRFKRGKRTNYYSLFKKGMGYANTAIAAYKLASKVAGLVNTEYKFSDYTYTALGLSNAGSSQIFPLCNPAQGTTANSRTGDSIRLKHLRLRIYINAGTDPTTVRVMLFKGRNEFDTYSGGTISQYTAANVLDYTSSDYIVISPRERGSGGSGTNTKLWTIYDKTFRVDDLDVNDKKIIKIDRKLRGHIKWQTASSTVVQTGGIYLMIVSDGAAGATQPTVNFCSRISFIDN